MPYLLRFDGSNDYVELSSTVNVSSSDNFSLKWRWPTSATGNHRVLGGSTFGSASSRIIHFSNGNIIIYGETGGNIAFSQSTDQTIDREIELRRVSGSLSLHYDGSQQGPSQSSSQSFTFGILGGNFSTSTIASDLYTFSFEVNGTLVNNYNKQTLSGPNDTVLPDTAGSNDGTLVNFPTDNSQWVFYNAGGAISAAVTELSQSFSESSSISISATLSASVTESNFDFTESSIAAITNNLISISVTEASQDFSESSSVDVSSLLSAAVTESSQSFAESSTTDISANISALVTEFAQDFDDSISINFTGSFTAEVTESAVDFDEACYIQLPVQRLVPRKTISVSNRSGSTIRVRRRSSTIRVK